MTTNHDPERFARMAIPHESDDAAKAALDAFFADVEAARGKHKILHVVILAEAVSVEAARISSLRLGRSERTLELAAIGYGSMRAERVEELAKYDAFLDGLANAPPKKSEASK